MALKVYIRNIWDNYEWGRVYGFKERQAFDMPLALIKYQRWKGCEDYTCERM